MRIEDAGLETEWYRNLMARVVRRPNRRGSQMFKRLLAKVLRWLVGQGYQIAQRSALEAARHAVEDLQKYANQPGRPLGSSTVYVQGMCAAILAALDSAEAKL